MVATTGAGQPLSHRRAQLAGPSGVKGLLANTKILAIAVFASLGGFVYGCKVFLASSNKLHSHEYIAQTTRACLVKS